MSILEVQSAGFSYPDSVVFKNISFSLRAGEIMCIVGPNGCGKTTLLDTILGLHRLEQGRIMVNEKDISRLASTALAREVAYVPQLHQKTFPYSVLEVVLMGRAAYTGFLGSPDKQDTAIAQQALEQVGLINFQHRPYTQLSGGEGQLVMIARALAQQTGLIIMDEPTAHLDFRHELMVLEKVVQLVRDQELSVLMATHFPNHAFYFENQGVQTCVAMMHDHTIPSIGPASDVLTEANLHDLYQVNAKLVTCQSANNKELRQIIPISTASGLGLVGEEYH